MPGNLLELTSKGYDFLLRLAIALFFMLTSNVDTLPFS